MSRAASSVGVCPVCGKPVEDRQKGFFCSDKQCKFALWKNNRYFESIGKSMNKSVVEKLLASGKVKLKNCKSAKTGKSFDAVVYMTVDDNGRTQFNMEFENGGKKK